MLSVLSLLDLSKYGAKGLFYGVFGLLFLFLLFSSSCQKDPVPIVTIEKSPAIEQTIVVPIKEIASVAILEDRALQAVSTIKVDTNKERVTAKVVQIKQNTTIDEQERHRQIGEAEISSLEDLYQEYYPSPTPVAPPSRAT